jgi:hypothetical protein
MILTKTTATPHRHAAPPRRRTTVKDSQYDDMIDITSTPAIIDKSAKRRMKREPSLASRHKRSRREPPVINFTSTPAAEAATTRTKKRTTSPAPRRQRRERLSAPRRPHRQQPAEHEPEHLLQRDSSPFLKREPSPAPHHQRVRSPAPLHRQYNSSPPPEREPSERSILSDDTTATTEYLQRHRIKSELGSNERLGLRTLSSLSLGRTSLRLTMSSPRLSLMSLELTTLTTSSRPTLLLRFPSMQSSTRLHALHALHTLHALRTLRSSARLHALHAQHTQQRTKLHAPLTGQSLVPRKQLLC